MAIAAYGKSSYWEERYLKDLEPFDWYQRYNGIKHIINKYIKFNSRVLNVGAGTSRVSEEMVASGYKEIISIDISATCISHMQEKFKDHPGLTYTLMDVCKLQYNDNSFDGVFDKGTFDSIVCGENSSANVEQMLTEISRVLKPGASFILISFGVPSAREHFLNKPKFNWRIEIIPIDKPKVLSGNGESDQHFVYIMTKGMPEPHK